MLLVLVPRLLHRDLIDLILFPIAYSVDLNQFLALNVAANFISNTQKKSSKPRGERPRNLYSVVSDKQSNRRLWNSAKSVLFGIFSPVGFGRS